MVAGRPSWASAWRWGNACLKLLCWWALPVLQPSVRLTWCITIFSTAQAWGGQAGASLSLSWVFCLQTANQLVCGTKSSSVFDGVFIVRLGLGLRLRLEEEEDEERVERCWSRAVFSSLSLSSAAWHRSAHSWAGFTLNSKSMHTSGGTCHPVPILPQSLNSVCSSSLIFSLSFPITSFFSSRAYICIISFWSWDIREDDWWCTLTCFL